MIQDEGELATSNLDSFNSFKISCMEEEVNTNHYILYKSVKHLNSLCNLLPNRNHNLHKYSK